MTPTALSRDIRTLSLPDNTQWRGNDCPNLNKIATKRLTASLTSNEACIETTELSERKKAITEERPLINVLGVQSPFRYRRIQKQLTSLQKRRKSSQNNNLIINYWDNRSPVATFEHNARILKHSLSRVPSNTTIHLPDHLKRRLTLHSNLLSTDYWEAHIEHWLSLNASGRKELLDNNLSPVIIQQDDPREKLHGQMGVVAEQDIQPFSIIAPYGGMYCVGNDLTRERSRYGSKVARYSVDCSVNGLQIDLCGYAHGNITICINANITYSQSDPVYEDNCCFVIAVYHGWPYAFIVSLSFIPKDAELLLDYGSPYWK